MPSVYCKSLVDFLAEAPIKVVGELALATGHHRTRQLANLQLGAGADQLHVLQRDLCTLKERLPRAGQWTILLEYSIPVIGRRPDAVLLGDGHVFVIEYKAG